MSYSIKKANANYKKKKAFVSSVASKLMRGITISLFVVAVSLGKFSELKAQALEIPTGQKYVHIGKNDNAYTLRFGNPPSTNDGNYFGFWQIGMYDNGLGIGPVYNLWNVPNMGSITGRALHIGNNGAVAINYWTTPTNAGGKLFVDGDVYVSGVKVHSSDRRYKQNIQPISNLDNLFKINSVQYKSSGEGEKVKLELFKQKNSDMNEQQFNSTVLEAERRIAEREADTRIYYGVIAQELREVYPDLVYEDSDGFLSVNYVGLIPVMLDAIKELKSEINAMKGFEKQSAEVVSSAKLYQNNPNPFTASTEIKYYIPEGSTSAVICIYDMVGGQVMKIENLGRGYSSVTLHGNRLRAGMYMYSLLVDGKEIDTKRMILTDK